MDATDFAIVRWMSPGGEGRYWGSRMVVDPRITPREIATRVGLSEVSVRSRIARMRARGLYLRDEVGPNPAILGVRLQGAEMPLRDDRRSEDLFAELGTIEGLLSARMILHNGRRRVWVNFVYEGPLRAAARFRRIERTCGSPAVHPPTFAWVPPVARPLEPAEWRVLAALRADPGSAMAEQADRAGLSPKTFARHYHTLLDLPAIFWTRIFDASRFPATAFHVYLKDPEEGEEVRARIERAVPGWIPFARGGLGEDPAQAFPWLAGLFWAPTPAAVEELAELLHQLPGVRRVVRRLPGRVETYPRWFDVQIQRRLGSPTRTPAQPVTVGARAAARRGAPAL